MLPRTHVRPLREPTAKCIIMSGSQICVDFKSKLCLYEVQNKAEQKLVLDGCLKLR